MLRTSLPRLWKQLFGGNNRSRTVNRKPRSVRLDVENLEDRQVPSTMTWNVTSNADPAALTPGTLRYAVTEANNYALTPGDVGTIQIASGLQPILLKEGQLELKAGPGVTTINGAGVSISGNFESRVFQVDSRANVVISGLTIEDGNESGTQVGGGIYNQGNLTVNDCNLFYDWAYEGGAIYNSGSLTVSQYSVFEDNNATSVGGAIFNVGTLNVNDYCFFGANNANGWAGAIFNDGSATVSFSSISSGNQIAGNTAGNVNTTGYGGGIFNDLSLTITGCTISGNSATYGGGIYNQGNVTVNGSGITGNKASQDGGGIANTLGLTVNSGSSISSNRAAVYGGGIFNESSGTVTVDDSAVSSNTASNDGGGILNSGFLYLQDYSVVSGNNAYGGAGIDNGGSVYVNSNPNGLYGAPFGPCFIESNHATWDGGGINNGGYLKLNNCYVDDNTAGSDGVGGGGGIMNDAGATASLYNSIISGNFAELGGGIYYASNSHLSWTTTNISNNYSYLFMIGANLYTP